MIQGNQFLHQPDGDDVPPRVPALSLAKDVGVFALTLKVTCDVVDTQFTPASVSVFVQRFQDQTTMEHLVIGALKIGGKKRCILAAIGENEQLSATTGQLLSLLRISGAWQLLIESG